MSRTIDERIVQMTFNNQEFERRANTTISTLGKLGNALNPLKLTQAFTGMSKAANSLDLSGVSGALDGVGKGFSVLEEVAVGALRRIGDAIAGQLLGGLNKVKSAIDSLTTQQIGAGFQKYNDLTSSVQTLVNSTGKSVEEIDGYLKRLMWYSDETSFGFTDMTKALGTMVSSGGNIDELIPMLMGVGNAVAYAGKGASEFSRVIYNLNQSYSTGALKTMDWRSIELAGADSKVLKEQLLGAAVELKTINKEQAKLSNFSDLVSKGVFTRDVMQKAFGSFAQMTLEAEKLVSEGKFDTAAEAIESLSGKYEEFAERAFKSAQEAKSLNEALEATKDAVSSGWMQSFQLIFGDYNESKALWTDVTETFWDIFASGAARRNSILEAWADIWDQMVNNPDDAGLDYSQWKEISPFLTQTQALVSAISEAVLTIRDSVIDTFRSVFPIHTMMDEDGNIVENYAYTAKKIFDLIEKIRKAFIDISENGIKSDFAVALRNDLRAVLEVIKTLVAYIKTFNEGFIKPLATRLKPVMDEVVTLFNNLGKIIFKTARNAREDMSPFEKFLSNILKILDPLITLLEKALHWINDLIEGVEGVTIFDGVFKTIGGIVQWISNAISGTVPKLSQFGDIISKVFGKVKDVIGEFLTSHGADMSKLAEGGFLAYLGVGLATLIKNFKGLKISELGKSLTKGLGEGVLDTFNALKEGLEGLFGKKQTDYTSKLESLARSLLVLAAALFVMSLIDGDKIASTLGMAFFAILEMLSVLAIMGGMEDPKGLRNSVKALQKIAFSLLELAVALKIMSTIDPLGMTTAIIGLGFALAELAIFMALLSAASKDLKKGNTEALAAMLTKLGFAMIEIAAAMKLMSTLDGEGLSRALIGMGVALAEIGVFIVGISKYAGKGATSKIMALGPAMMGIGFALIEIAAAMKLLSTIDQAGSDRALVSLLGMLGTIGLFITLVSRFTKGGGLGFIAIASGMLILSAAIGALTVALIAMSAIGWEKMKEGLKVLASMMLVVGGVSAVLGLVSPLILAFALSLTALGIAFGVVSAGILKGVQALMLLQMLGPGAFGKIVDVLVGAFEMIIALIPSFILGIIQAVINVSGKLIELVGQVIQIVITAINENLPVIIDGIIAFVSSVLDGIGNAINDWGPKIFQILEDLINLVLDWLTSYIPTLIEKIGDFLVSAINGLAEFIRSGGGAIGSALGNLAGALIEGLFGAVGGILGGVGGGIINTGKNLWEGAKGLFSSIFGSEDSAAEQQESGETIVTNVVAGMDANKQEALDKGKEIGTDTAEEMARPEEAKKSGKDTLDGLIVGLSDGALLDEIYRKGAEAGKMFMKGYNSEMDINSPSRVMMKEADYTIAGLIEGFKNLGDVKSAGIRLGEEVYNSIAGALTAANSILDDSLNPVITPVLDLTELKDNSNAISGLLGSDLSYNGALSVASIRNAQGIQNGLGNGSPINVNVDFTINNGGKDVTYDDIKNWIPKITTEVNIRLGKLLKI